MTKPIKRCLLVGKHVRKYTPGPKFELLEREMTPAQEKALFREQDENFCAAMKSAIACGLERI